MPTITERLTTGDTRRLPTPLSCQAWLPVTPAAPHTLAVRFTSTLPTVRPSPLRDWLPTMATVPLMRPRLMTEFETPPQPALPLLLAITTRPLTTPLRSLTSEFTVPPPELPRLFAISTVPVMRPSLRTLFTVPLPRASPRLPCSATVALLMRPLLRTLLTVALPEPPPWFWLMTMRLDSITPRRVLSSVLTAERPRAWPWLPATNTWLPVMRPRLRTLFTWPSSALSPRLPTMVI